MSELLPRFDDPPLVETVMSVQFSPLVNLTAPYGGWYWKRYLDACWTTVEQASPVLDQFERFGEEQGWSQPGMKVAITATPEPVRIQIVQNDGERMIQVQRTRFMYNWRMRGSTYPSYAALRPEFDAQFERFAEFVAEAELGNIETNQWEMTYVNHIPKDGLWKTPNDWGRVFPNFRAPLSGHGTRRFESFGGEWHFVIEPDRARLHVAMQHGRTGPAGGSEILVLQLTVRGPIQAERGWDLDSGFELGHETIVRAFAELTSPAAHDAWGRRTE